MEKDDDNLRSFDEIVGPLRVEFERFSLDELDQLTTVEAVLACEELLRRAAKETGHESLAKTLNFHKARRALKARAGGISTHGEFAKRLDVSPAMLDGMVEAGLVLAVEDFGQHYFPNSQLNDCGRLLAGLDAVLQCLRRMRIDGWMAMDVLHSPFPGVDLSPMELLTRGREADAIKCVLSLENQGAA